MSIMSNAPKNKILLLGGFRSGKSTILSIALQSFNNKVSHLCTLNDATPYGNYSSWLIPLRDRSTMIDGYLRKRNKFGNNSQFIVDMSPSWHLDVCNLIASIQGTSRIGLDFVDIPGSWLINQDSLGYQKITELVQEVDIFVIAIDTPYLMQDENPNINTVWNCTEEINNLLSGISTKDKNDRKLIIFVPVKCEKWINSGEIDKVTERVKQTYSVTINKWVNNPVVEMWVMPIETVGGIESVRLLDAYRFYQDQNDRIGETCSIDPFTGFLILCNGKILQKDSVWSVDEEPDRSFKLESVQRPLSWYKTNGKGFSPRNCEQIIFHILRFLVGNEEIKSKNFDNNYQDTQLWWMRQNQGFFGPYLPKYRELMGKLHIKTSGDGFQRIETMVINPDDD